MKEAVFPFARFANVDPQLGPEMRSTGEVMGWDDDFGAAFLKSQIAAGVSLPTSGTVFVSLKDGDKQDVLPAARKLIEMGFDLVATTGTQKFLSENGVEAGSVRKVIDGRDNIVDDMINGKIDLVFNTTEGMQSLEDSKSIRRTAVVNNIPYFTTLSSSVASVQAIEVKRTRDLTVRSLQDA